MTSRASLLTALPIATLALWCASVVVVVIGIWHGATDVEDPLAALAMPLPVLLRTLLVPLAVALLAAALATPVALTLRGGPRWLAAPTLAPLLLSSGLIYAALAHLRAPRTPIGDLLHARAEPGLLASVRTIHAITALALWAWPVAALVLLPRARTIPRAFDELLAIDAASAWRRATTWLGVLAGPLLAASSLVLLLLLGSAVPLHLAEVRTWTIEVWRLLAESASPAPGWSAALPLLAIAPTAGLVASALLVRMASAATGPDEPGRRPDAGGGVRAATLAIWSASVLVPLLLFAAALDAGAGGARLLARAGALGGAPEPTAGGWALLVLVLAVPVVAALAGAARRPLLRVCAGLAALGVPLALVAASAGPDSTLLRFWAVSGERVLTSSGVAGATAGLALVTALGCAAGASGVRRRAAGTMLRLASVTALVPGVLLGAAIASAGTLPPFDLLGSTVAGLALADLLRFGVVPAAAGTWIALAEPRALRDLRQLDGGGLRGWLATVARPAAPVLLASAAAVGLLTIHEIETAVMLAPAGAEVLSQQLLQQMHYLRLDDLAAAGVWLVGGGVVASALVLLGLLGGGARRRGALAAALLPLAASLGGLGIAGCDRMPDPGAALRVTGTLGERGTAPGQLVFPRAIDDDGESLWIIDKTARVQQMTPDGDVVRWWPMPRADRGRPVGLTCGPDGLVYIADTHEHRVAVFEPRGDGADLVRTWGSYGTGPGEFIYPTDVAILTDPATGAIERVFVSEYGGNDRISAFDADGGFLFAFDGAGGTGGTEGGFRRPQSIALDPTRRELLVADASNHRLGRFALDGVLLGWIGDADGLPGRDLGRFHTPFGLAVLRDGSLLVTEFGNQRVQRIEPTTGTSLGSYGRGGWGSNELIQPWAVTVMGSTAYVLDSGKDRVVAFRCASTGVDP